VRILAIDPGTSCGWAVRHSADTWDSGVWDLAPRRHEGGGMRFLRLRAYLREVLDRFPPDVVAYEEVRMHRGVDAAHIYGGVVAVVVEECEARKIPYSTVHYATAKKTATGKGNADKAAMVAAANARWPRAEPFHDDEADARWIAEAAARDLADVDARGAGAS
jgi:crossover junction endodeoxyribonuclease RuvC